MPIFFFDIEADDGDTGDQGTSTPTAAEIVARHFHDKVQAPSCRHMLSPDRKGAELTPADPIEIDTTAPKTSRQA